MLESVSMRARIFLPPKSAMQSGRAGSEWVLHYDSDTPERADRLMGWIGGGDTQAQVRLSFPTKEEAVAYAERNGIPYDLEIPRERRGGTKADAHNFSPPRNENWTHWASAPMAVYTEVTDEALETFLTQYDIGSVVAYRGIAEG